MEVGHVVKKTVWPMYKSSTAMNLNIYSAKHGSPLSCSESGVKREGQFVIALPEYTGAERSVRRAARATAADACAI